MRTATIIATLVTLTACSGGEKLATYSCPRGPDLTVAYSDAGATLYFPDGRVELLPRPDPERPNLYAKPGFRWATGGRDARLDEGSKSFLCDQMAG